MLTQKKALAVIKKMTAETVGCTDPVAIALAAAAAYNAVLGSVKEITITIDKKLYKNAFSVGIPIAEVRGIELATALGIVINKPEKKLMLFENVTKEDVAKAKKLMTECKINIQLDEKKNRLFVLAEIKTALGVGTALIEEFHDNIIYIKKNGENVFLGRETPEEIEKDIVLSKEEMLLSDFIQIADGIKEEEIEYLENYAKINLIAAQEGLSHNPKMNLGVAFKNLIKKKSLEDSFINDVRTKVASAVSGRMGGKRLFVISCGGSGNHGIVFFITAKMAYEKWGASKRTLNQSLFLGLLIMLSIKIYTGILTPMCGCSIAAAASAAGAIAYAMGGSEKQILASINLIFANLSGLICDGAKYSCALKVATSAQAAIEAALLAMNDFSYDNQGVTGVSFKETLENIAYLHNKGMERLDDAVLTIYQKKSLS